MKKKIYGALAMAFTMLVMSTVTSCNDSIQDVKTEVIQYITSTDSPISEIVKQYTQKLEAELAELQNRFNNYKSCSCDEEAVKQRISDLETALETAKTELQQAINQKANQSDLDNLGGKVDNLGDKVGENEAAIDSLNQVIDSLTTRVSQLSNELIQLKTYVEQTYVTKETYNQAINELKDAIAQINECKCDTAAILSRLTAVEQLAAQANGTAKAASELAEKNAAMLDSLKTVVGVNTEDIKNLKETVAENSKAIEDMGKKYTDLSLKFDSLSTKVDENFTILDQRILGAINKATEAMEKAKADSALLAARLDILEAHSAQVDSLIDALDGKVENLDSISKVLTDNVTSMGLDIETLKSRTDYLYTRTDSLATACTQALEDAKKYADEQIAGVLLSIANLDSIATSHDGRLKALEDLTGEHAEKLNEIFSRADVLDSIVGAHGENLSFLDSLTNAHELSIGELKSKTDSILTVCDFLSSRIDDVNNRVDTLENRLDEVETQMAELVTKVDNILKVLAGQLNGIIIQGTVNPAFGTISLPTGLNTKMLMAYFGQAMNEIYFPTQRTGNYVRSEQALTSKDMSMLNVDTDPIFYDGDLMLSTEDYNAGTIYVTINPNSVNCEGMTLGIENSQAVKSGVKLSPLVRSNETLPFGWNRRGADYGNGFYEAKAFITNPNEVQQINLNTGKIRDAIKEIVNNKQKANMVKIATDLYSVVSQLNLDRNAVKASYMNLDADGNEIQSTIYSNYDLAATAVKPLSLESYKDLNYKTIPGYERANKFLDKIGDKLKGMVGRVVDRIGNDKIFEHIADLKLKLKKIEFKGFTEERLGQLDITIDKNIVFADQECTIHFENPMEVTIENNSGATTIVYEVRNARGVLLGYVDLTDLTTDLVGSLDATDVQVVLSGLEYHLVVTANINSLKAMLTEINGELDNAMEDINDVFAAVRDMCDDVNSLLDLMYDYETKFDNKVDKLLDKVRDYIDRINNKIVSLVNNTNHRFQPLMLMKTNDRVISLSRAKSQPTTVKKNATLVPTTWTFELIVPLCKKHIGVTNVFKGEASAQDGNADCRAKLIAANNCKDMNEVISGDVRFIELNTLTPGYTYEIAYSGLDFHGKIATYKYYITVVE